jgi:hypothetical protein
MADASALIGLTGGLAAYLSLAYQLRPLADLTAKFEVTGVSDIKKLDGQATKVTLFLYRVTHNEHLRNRNPANLPSGQRMPLTVNLHLLVTVWSDTGAREQALLGWVLRELHQRPLLDLGVLGAVSGFGADEQIQLSPEDLTLDDLSKLWQVLVPPYRPSLGYVARNVRIDLDPVAATAPVVARRLAISDELEAAR